MCLSWDDFHNPTYLSLSLIKRTHEELRLWTSNTQSKQLHAVFMRRSGERWFWYNYINHRSVEWAWIIEWLPCPLQLNILMKFLSHCVSKRQLSPSKCTGTNTTMERYDFKITNPGGEWIKLFLSSKEVATATIGLAVASSARKVP